MQEETAYLQALREHSGDKILPAVVELLSLHVCVCKIRLGQELQLVSRSDSTCVNFAGLPKVLPTIHWYQEQDIC